MVSMLWDVSRERASVDAFVGEYGFHGPGEGALSSAVWRERPDLLDGLLASYAAVPEDPSPQAVATRVAETRRTAAAELLQALPAAKRPVARLLLRLTDTYWPLRETGKATLLHCIDVGRVSARRLGEHLAGTGALEDADDVAYLNVDELIEPAAVDCRDEVAFRKERREVYLTYTLPQTWEGVPEPIPETEALEAATRLTALGGSAGVAEGRVRVIDDPRAVDLADGELLVCRNTDPSWAALFLVASAVVIDVGGPMSHGAIVSRELGLPCVINTRTGTQTLRTGDLVRVDGDAGTVEVLAGAPA